MKNITMMIFFTFVLVLKQNWAQYNIPEIQGIPLISYDTDWIGWTEEDYKTMKDSAGVDILIATNLSSAKLQRLITGPGLYAIPNQTTSQQNPEVKNWIYYYSEGRYTNWEAEGTNPEDGDTSVYYKNNIGTVFQEGSIKGIATNDYALADTLIYGPLYRQEVRYFVTDTNIINYKTDYKLKLVNLPHRQGDPLPQLTDEICRLQVTVSDIYIDTIPDPDVWVKVTTPVLGGDVLLRRSDFSIGNWETKTIEYRLNELADNFYERITNSNGENKFAQYVEFKIIWLGDPNSKLFVDNIVVSDERGRNIHLPAIQDQIIQQDNATYIANNYEEFIKAWIGRDEPESIDMFEPIRIISSVLNDNNGGDRPLIMNLSSTWNGRFGDQIPWKNSNYVAKSVEFVKRTKNIHIWQNTYMFDYPFKYNGELWWVDDFRDWNIKIFADSMLSRINKVDPQFGQLILCGKFDHNVPNVSFREIAPHEFAYANNLSLMYGAKSLVLFGYFGNDNPPYPNYTGLVNWDFGEKNKTDRFYYVKNILSPRLKGLMGRTLRTITPTEQVLKASYLTWHNNFIKLLINSSDPAYGKDFDLGFFKDTNNLDYFMLINRWYNTVSPIVPLQFTSVSFGNYNNIQLYNLVDSSKTTILNNGIIYPTIILGDALFYRVAPVVRAGGTLITNETTLPNETLLGDMTVENGATLTVNGNYYAKANITVKTGGKIIAGPNGKIIFDTGKKLIIEGTTEIKGSSFINKLTLEFSSSETGIDVLPGSSLTLSYCNITGAYNGLVTRTGTPSYLNITYSNFAFGSTGIVLNGNYFSGCHGRTVTKQS